MTKKYELLKDLPSVKKGSIYSKSEFSDWYQTEGEEWDTCIPVNIIENKEWFREAKEVVEKEFVWTDELVKELLWQCSSFPDPHPKLKEKMEEFKRWKSRSIQAGKGTANDVLNTETIDDFWKRHNIREMNDNGGYNFLYNNKQCFGQVTTLPHTTQLKIRPCLSTDDIGTGAGQSVFKYFPRNDAKENYYNDLRDADKWRKKERMEVNDLEFDAQERWMKFYFTHEPNFNKIPAIKSAIEKILNHE